MENSTGPTFGNGKIAYVEIPADSIERSSEFYQSVFGWNIRVRSDGNIAFDDGINEVSGTWVTGRASAIVPGIMLSIMVDNMAEIIKKITDQRCNIVKEMAISDTEMIAWFEDPAGNVLGLYQHPGGGHGKICYLEIPADDIARSANFYETVFGWSLRSDDHGSVSFNDGVDIVSGMWTTDLKASPSGLLIYIMMDSVEETAEAIISNGGKIIQPPKGNSKEDIALFSDPAGNVLGISQQ